MITARQGSQAASNLPSLPLGIDTNWYLARQVDKHPKAIGSVRPVYPEAAQRDDIEGTLKLKLRIDDLGRVQDAEVVEAMKRANSTDPAKYASEIAKTNYNGVTGNVQFDEKGDIKDGAVTVYQVKDGSWVALETVGGNTPVAAPAPAEEKKQ